MKRHALFVGVDQYADGHIPDLSCAVNDAMDLHGFFKYGAGYDQVELLQNPAGKKEVLGAVRELTSSLGTGDFFLFFFAGHGFRVGENHVLVCAKDLYDDVKYEDDGLPLGQLKRRLAGPFDSALLLDACQSDILATRGGEGIAERDLALIHAPPASRSDTGTLTIVTSCDAGQTAAELSERRHGLFTMAMLDLLKEAQGEHVRLDLSDAFRQRLGRRMGEIAARSGLSTGQRPRFSFSGESCFILLDGAVPDACNQLIHHPPVVPPHFSDPELVVCPVCGKKNHPEDTFKCRGCGRDDLCHRHLDEKTNLCADCTARTSVSFGVKTHEWNVLLVNSGPRKIDVIKEIRAFTGLGLKESMNLVESAPVNVKENVPRSEAERLKRQLERVGASVELTVGEEEESESRTGPTKKEYQSGDWENSLVHADEMGKVEVSSRLRPDGSWVGELISPADPRSNNHFDASSGSDAPAKRKPSVPRVGRNDPCPCGSGKKYKKCCGQEEGPRWASTVQSGRRAGETKTIVLPGGAEMEMVWCPPGNFTMGSTNALSEEPPHNVTLTEGFWMAKYPVTQEQWQSVMGNNPAHYKGTNLPVENVSWDDCVEFCRKAGYGLRLPTEAQWEYACRAGSTGAYAGMGRLAEMGWYEENSGKKTHPVGKKRANAWGLYDMHGNVWEWCADWFAGGYYAQSPVENPKGPVSGEYRMLRGGSYWCDPLSCRSAQRLRCRPGIRIREHGFRPVSRQD